MHEEHTTYEQVPMHGGHPSQEGLSAWFLEYFGKLNATVEQIEKRQELHEKYIDQLDDIYVV